MSAHRLVALAFPCVSINMALNTGAWQGGMAPLLYLVLDSVHRAMPPWVTPPWVHPPVLPYPYMYMVWSEAARDMCYGL